MMKSSLQDRGISLKHCIFLSRNIQKRLCRRNLGKCRELQVAFSHKEEQNNEIVFCKLYDWSVVWSCDLDHLKVKQETLFPILKERTQGGKTVLALFEQLQTDGSETGFYLRLSNLYKGYLQTLNIFTHTPKHSHDPLSY